MKVLICGALVLFVALLLRDLWFRLLLSRRERALRDGPTTSYSLGFVPGEQQIPKPDVEDAFLRTAEDEFDPDEQESIFDFAGNYPEHCKNCGRSFRPDPQGHCESCGVAP